MVSSVRIDPVIGERGEVRTDVASLYVLERALIKKLMTVSTNTYFITECQQKLNRVKRKNKLQKLMLLSGPELCDKLLTKSKLEQLCIVNHS